MGARAFYPDGDSRRRAFLGTAQEPAVQIVGHSRRAAGLVNPVCGVCLRPATRSRGPETSPEELARPRRGNAFGPATGSAYSDDCALAAQFQGTDRLARGCGARDFPGWYVSDGEPARYGNPRRALYRNRWPQTGGLLERRSARGE